MLKTIDYGMITLLMLGNVMQGKQLILILVVCPHNFSLKTEESVKMLNDT